MHNLWDVKFGSILFKTHLAFTPKDIYYKKQSSFWHCLSGLGLPKSAERFGGKIFVPWLWARLQQKLLLYFFWIEWYKKDLISRDDRAWKSESFLLLSQWKHFLLLILGKPSREVLWNILDWNDFSYHYNLSNLKYLLICVHIKHEFFLTLSHIHATLCPTHTYICMFLNYIQTYR